MSKIGFIGVGNMGGPMACNLVAAGHDVCVFDLSAEAVDACTQKGASAASGLAQAATGRDVVITMLPAGPHMRDVYTQAEGVLEVAKPGCLLIDCSTIDVETARTVWNLAKAKGFAMIDAPVSGGVMGAQAGALTFMVGGDDGAVAMAKPYLEIMGKTVVHAGGAGNGQAAKICNNMILGISMIGVCEAFALAETLGLDAQNLFDVSATASGQCWSLTTYCPVPGPVPTSPANRDYAAGFTAAMMLKDLRLSQDAAQKSGAVTPLGAQAATLYGLFEKSGHGNVDFSGIIKMISGKL